MTTTPNRRHPLTARHEELYRAGLFSRRSLLQRFNELCPLNALVASAHLKVKQGADAMDDEVANILTNGRLTSRYPRRHDAWERT